MQLKELHSVLTRLAKKRPVFHSEADFQHALAWQLQQENTDASIRLEKQVTDNGPRAYLDLLFRSRSKEVAIELKYKSRALQVSHDRENFSLQNHSAQNFGRYDFVKDVQRLEQYVRSHRQSQGYAILLTNDPGYWQKPRKGHPEDLVFRIHEGQILKGSLGWRSPGSSENKKRRKDPIKLRNVYTVQWTDYSSVGSGKLSQFRCLILHIAPGDR